LRLVTINRVCDVFISYSAKMTVSDAQIGWKIGCVF